MTRVSYYVSHTLHGWTNMPDHHRRHPDYSHRSKQRSVYEILYETEYETLCGDWVSNMEVDSMYSVPVTCAACILLQFVEKAEHA